MQQKSKAVVFIAMAYPSGGIRHLALLGNELHKCANGCFDFYVASVCREADRGFWAEVKSGGSEEYIIRAETFAELAKKSVVLAKKYDHLIIHTGGGYGQTKHFVCAQRNMEPKFATRITLVGTTHSYRHDSWMRVPMSAFQYVLYRVFYRMIVFQCQYAADRFVGGNDLIRRGRGMVIPLGCESFPKVTSIPSRTIVDKKLDGLLGDDHVFKFVYLAGFRPGKMHVWLVHAIAPVLKRHAEARVLFCGMGNPNVISATEEAVADEGLSDRILLTGQIPRDEVPWLLQHSNCALVPSRAETFGHNFLEPMFAGLPVLGTRVGIGRDIIKDRETGMGFSLEDPESLRNAAEYVLASPANAKQMGASAKKLVENQFRHSDVARHLNRLYCKLFAEN